VADDWRVTVELEDEGDAIDLVAWLHEVEEPGDRVIVSRDGPRVFLYADSARRGEEAQQVVLERLGEHGLAAQKKLERWHPAGQDWEDASVPLPQTEEELEVERDRVHAREELESRESGYAEWEVRVELPTHEETVALAERLEAEGSPVLRRATFLLVGAVNEEEAKELAERIRGEAPEGARVAVQPGGEMAWEVMPQNPFVIFGGLGA
jgi:hypothetical protein